MPRESFSESRGGPRARRRNSRLVPVGARLLAPGRENSSRARVAEMSDRPPTIDRNGTEAIRKRYALRFRSMSIEREQLFRSLCNLRREPSDRYRAAGTENVTEARIHRPPSRSNRTREGAARGTEEKRRERACEARRAATFTDYRAPSVAWKRSIKEGDPSEKKRGPASLTRSTKGC